MWVLDYKESWALKNWCFWIVVLEKTLESSLDCKEIKPINLKRNQSWIGIGRTGAKAETIILWPPNVKNWFIGKDPDDGKDWRQEEKGMTEEETGKSGMLQSMGHKELDTTEQLNWTELNVIQGFLGGSVVKNPPAMQDTWVWFLD